MAVSGKVIGVTEEEIPQVEVLVVFGVVSMVEGNLVWVGLSIVDVGTVGVTVVGLVGPVVVFGELGMAVKTELQCGQTASFPSDAT